MGLAPAERTRLAKVLAMLGSPHQGERDAAALAADRLVRGAGIAWADVLAGDVRTNANGPPPSYGSCASHLGDLATCSLRPDLLTAWEQAFVVGLARRRSLSQRQREILAECAAKVRSAGPRAG